MQTQRLETLDTSLVVTLDEAKAHLIVGHEDDDVYITRCIASALSFAEERLEVSLRIRRHKTYGCHWPCNFELPYGPVRVIESVSYFDDDGLPQEVPVTDWQVVKRNRVDLFHFINAPTYIASSRLDAVSVTYVAGYGPLGAEFVEPISFAYELPVILGYRGSAINDVDNRLPDNIRRAVYMLIGHYYENRETVVVGAPNAEVALAATHILQQSRVLGI